MVSEWSHMPSLREIMLNRAKEPAKVHPMDRVATPQTAPDSPRVNSPAQAITPQRNGYGRPPKPKATPGQRSPGSAGSVQRTSEERRPRAQSVTAQRGRRTPSEPPPDGGEEMSTPGKRAQGTPTARAKARSLSANRAPDKIRIGDAAPPIERKDVGKVPAYLKRRQAEMAEEKRIAARPVSPQPPPGFRKVGEEEREDTLEVLRLRKEEVEKAQRGLPFKIETVGQKQREKDLSDRLAHIEKLTGMFSKPVVFVPADSGPIAASLPSLGEKDQKFHAQVGDSASARKPVRSSIVVNQAPGGHSNLTLG
ncbi:unnamed protein product [Effrenium voratum]|uniref:Enkurin domain-containing protein n=1 Tax=Effrenium voratum TaxID=2562239 RepID=A0AA36IMC8_9DINO|nr:unnamed protein product [Effrenium voratum]CAJ1389365.1 unnamed protein product [Effrenium voratum]